MFFLPQFGVGSELSLNRRTVAWNLIVGSKFTVFALFYFVFEGNIPSKSSRGAYIFRGLYLEGLIFGILRYYVFTQMIDLVVLYHFCLFINLENCYIA